MRYVQFDPFGGCWLWDSGTTFNGHMEYPMFNLEPARSVRVSRFMWERRMQRVAYAHDARPPSAYRVTVWDWPPRA